MTPKDLKFSARHFKDLDWLLIACLLALTLIGIIVIDGSKYPYEKDIYGDEAGLISKDARKQIIFSGICLLAFVSSVS